MSNRLDRWDQRNQRTLDYHNETYRGFGDWRHIMLAMVAAQVVWFLARVTLGEGWAMVALAVTGTACFVVLFVQERRRRRRWEPSPELGEQHEGQPSADDDARSAGR